MKNSQWALVTGASAGVGREIAVILASKGWNLVLAARSEDKLSVLKEELISSYAVQIEVIKSDLSKPDSAKAVFDFCVGKNIAVDLLINNAGTGAFGESVVLQDSVIPMIHLNVISLTQLCALFGSQMKERKSGSILNVGSIAGNQPTSYFASYAASKSYVLNYSLALRHELSPYNVHVTCVQPGYIRTAFDDNCNVVSEKYKKFSHKNGMTALAVAKCCVSSVLHKRSYVRAGLTNKIAAFVSGLIPRNFLAWILSISVRSMTK
ncbi:MAG: SDR family oxidoreductase [Spirochaetaceae bacterium]|nr:SDR family oxidoreductase [Spirochaetaceae bacterium]